MSKKNQRTLIRILVAIGAFTGAFLIPAEGNMQMFLFLPAYLIAGGDVLLAAARGILHGQVFDENFLMSIATVGAFCLGEYPEGVMVMVLYQIGELFQSYAVGRSRKSIGELMAIRPDYANVQREGTLYKLDPEEVQVGECIVVAAGEKIPLDGVVVEGYATADTSALTGESAPRELSPGSEALSGCVNLDGVLSIRVTKEFGQSTASKILDLVENAGSRKAKAESFITRFARYYTPGVVIAAAAIAVLPPLLLPGAQFAEWVRRALTFLVISCPCALVISVPLSFFGGIGGASKSGVLIKGGNYLEALADAEMVVFDKTGTLTKGNFAVTEVHAVHMQPARLLEIAAFAEAYSEHPIAASLKRAYGAVPDRARVSGVREHAGGGVSAMVDGVQVLAGNARLMAENEIIVENNDWAGTVVHVAVDGIYEGAVLIADELKEDAAAAIADLKRVHQISFTAMLTGDNEAVAQAVGQKAGIDAVYAGLLPSDKVRHVEQLLAKKTAGRSLVFVGDGVNDAPVLTRADVGVAMGGLGSDAAIEAADVVLMGDEPSKLCTAIAISRRTMRIVRQNIVFALGVKAFFLLLGVFGIASMWEAVFADVGVSILAILNAMRALRIKDCAPSPKDSTKRAPLVENSALLPRS